MSVINTNTKALVAQESIRSGNLSLSQAMERLSTGKKKSIVPKTTQPAWLSPTA